MTFFPVKRISDDSKSCMYSSDGVYLTAAAAGLSFSRELLSF